ncbi:MAG: RNA polymerase sigma factor [Thermoanaerobaculia bacterium]
MPEPPEPSALPSDPAAAIEVLARRHGPALYNLALRLCGSPADAEELVQETFLNAYRAWEGFEGRSKVSTWLFTIARHACQRMHRRRAGEPARIEPLEELLPGPDEAVVDLEAASPFDEQMAREARSTVETALGELPVEFRLPLVLVDIAELSIGEAAEVLGLKENTVKTRVHRARHKLRRAIERTLPHRRIAATEPTEICLSMLQAKQEALDRRVDFPYPDDALCERCSAVFAALDLGRDACAALARSTPPRGFATRIVEAVRAGG